MPSGDVLSSTDELVCFASEVGVGVMFGDGVDKINTDTLCCLNTPFNVGHQTHQSNRAIDVRRPRIVVLYWEGARLGELLLIGTIEWIEVKGKIKKNLCIKSTTKAY